MPGLGQRRKIQLPDVQAAPPTQSLSTYAGSSDGKSVKLRGKSSNVVPEALDLTCSSVYEILKERQEEEVQVREDYHFIEQIGRGSSSTVWRAVSRSPGPTTTVAIKEYLRSGEGEMECFAEREFDMLRTLHHRNIVRPVNLYLGEKIYLALEYVPAACRNVMRQLLNALFYLHSSKHICHRDVKPSNIVAVEPNRLEVSLIVLIDFNIASQFQSTPIGFSDQSAFGGKSTARASGATSSGMMTPTGTNGYMAPEVSAGDEALGDAADRSPLTRWTSGRPGKYCGICYKTARASWLLMRPRARVELMEAMTASDSVSRPTVQQCLVHSWLLETTEYEDAMNAVRRSRREHKSKTTAAQLLMNKTALLEERKAARAACRMQVVHVVDPPAAAPPQSNAGASPAPTSDDCPSTALWGLWDCFLTYFVTLPLKAATLTAICAILTALVFPSVYYWLVEVVLKILLRRTLADFVLKRPSGGGAEVDLTTVNGTMKVSAKVGPLGISLWNRGLVVPSIDIAVDILEIPKKDPAARRRKRADAPTEDSGGASWWKELLFRSCFINIGIINLRLTLPGRHLGVDRSRVSYCVVVEEFSLAKAGPVSPGEVAVRASRGSNVSREVPEVQIAADALRVEVPVLLFRESLLAIGPLIEKPDPDVSGDPPEKDVIDPSMPAVSCTFTVASLVVSVSDLAVGRCEVIGSNIKIPSSLQLDDIDLEGERKTALRLDPPPGGCVEVHGRGIYIDVDVHTLWGLIAPESFIAWFKAIDHLSDVFKSVKKPWKIVRRNEIVKQYYAWELCRRVPDKEAVPYRYVPDPIRVRLHARSVEIHLGSGQHLLAKKGFLMFDDQQWKFVLSVDAPVLYGVDGANQKLITAKRIDVWVPLSVFPQLSRPLGPFPVVPDFVKNVSAQCPARGALPIAVLFTDAVTKFDDALFGCINYLIEAAVHDVDRFPEVVDTGTRVFLDPPQFKSMLFVGTNVVADLPIPGTPPIKMSSLELAMGPTKDSMHIAVCRASIAGCLSMRNDLHIKVSCYRRDPNDPSGRRQGQPRLVSAGASLPRRAFPGSSDLQTDRNRKLALTAECSIREAAVLAAGAVEAYRAFDREFTSTGPPKGPLRDLAVDLCALMISAVLMAICPSPSRSPVSASPPEAIHFTYLKDTKEMELTLTAVIVQMLPKVITACLPEAHFALLDEGTRAVVVLGTETVSPEIAAFENALSVSCRLTELQHILEDLLVEFEAATALGRHPPAPRRATRSVEFLSGMCFTWAVRGLEPLQLLTADPIVARLVFNTHGATGSPALVLPALDRKQDPVLAQWLTEPWCLDQPQRKNTNGSASSSSGGRGGSNLWDIDSYVIDKIAAYMKGLEYLKDLKPGLIKNSAVYSMGEGILDKPVYAQFDAEFTNPTLRWGAGSSISHVNSVQLRLLVHNLPSSPDAMRDTVDPPVCISWSAEFRDSASTGNQQLSFCVVPEFHIPMVLQLIGSPRDFYQINGQNVKVSLNTSGHKKRSLSTNMHRRFRTTSATGVSANNIFGNIKVAFNILLSEITCKCGAWRCGASEISLATDSSCATGSIVGSIRNAVIGFEVVRPHRLTPTFERHCAFCTPSDNPYPLRNVAPFIEIEDVTLTLHSNLVPTFGAGRSRVSDDPHEVALLYLGLHGTRICWSPVIQRCMRMTLLNVDQFFKMMNRWRERFVEGLKYHDKMCRAEAMARRPEAASYDDDAGEDEGEEEEEPLHVRIEKAWSAVMLVGRSASAVLRVSDVQLNCHYAAAADGKAATIEHEDTSTLSTTPSTPCGEEFKCGCRLLAAHAVYDEDYRQGEGRTWWVRQHGDDTPLPPLPPFNLSVAAASVEEIRLGAYPWKQIVKAIITNDELGFDEDIDPNEGEEDSIAGKLPNGAQLVLCIGEAVAEVRGHRTSATGVDNSSNLRLTLALTLDGLRGLVGSTKPCGVAWSGSYDDALKSVTELSTFTLRGTADILPVGDSSVQACVERIFLAADDLSFHQVVSVITECLLYRPGTHEDDGDGEDEDEDDENSRSAQPYTESPDAPVTLTERISPGELKRLRSEISDVVSEDFGDGSPSGSKLVIEYTVGELSMNLAHADSVFLRLKLDDAAGTHVFAHSDPGHPMMFSFELRDITVTGSEGMQIVKGAHSKGTSLLQFRGQDRIVQHNGQRWHIYDAVTVNLAPIVVNLTQQLFEEVYAFIFLDPTGEDMSLFGDINALFSYKSKRMTLKDVSLKVRHYVRKRRLWTWRDCLDEWGSRFFHQALSSVVLHPFSRKPKYFGGEHIVSREEVARALFGKYAPANASIAPRMPVSPRNSASAAGGGQQKKHRHADGPGPPPSRSRKKREIAAVLDRLVMSSEPQPARRPRSPSPPSPIDPSLRPDDRMRQQVPSTSSAVAASRLRRPYGEAALPTDAGLPSKYSSVISVGSNHYVLRTSPLRKVLTIADSELRRKLLAEDRLAQPSIVSNPSEDDSGDSRCRARCQLFLKIALAFVATMITMTYFLWGPPALAMRPNLPIMPSGAVVLGNTAGPALETPESSRQYFLDVQSSP
ncbi:Cyclin-dependent kinase 8 [Perkinsus olseni]|uniref:Cyclin-dependent kinase 8 n=1 Tax=Perkinsus olseni TaxID=32597 RepID=A0A7J6NRZ1_PEROL|nr:Cyclin-dependent kinase 8 [Perkinsus olseni]